MQLTVSRVFPPHHPFNSSLTSAYPNAGGENGINCWWKSLSPTILPSIKNHLIFFGSFWTFGYVSIVCFHGIYSIIIIIIVCACDVSVCRDNFRLYVSNVQIAIVYVCQHETLPQDGRGALTPCSCWTLCEGERLWGGSCAIHSTWVFGTM